MCCNVSKLTVNIYTRGDNSQKKATLANVKPMIIPGAVMSMIRRRPTISIYLSATSVKMKFVPATMRETAVG